MKQKNKQRGSTIIECLAVVMALLVFIVFGCGISVEVHFVHKYW